MAGPDAALPIDAPGMPADGIVVYAWSLPAGGMHGCTVTMNAPANFANTAGATTVTIHFLTGQESSAQSGQVTFNFAAMTGTPPNQSVSSYGAESVSVTSSASSQAFNHYDVTFTLNQLISPNDFLALDVARDFIDNYAGTIYLTSIEFKYAQQ